MKKISVIVPIYNVEKYLSKCIESIIHQTYSELEMILVNDGSTDGCGKICDEFQKKDSRIKVIHKENGGLSDARNVGIEMATGDYIFCIDSDDYIDLDMFDYCLKELEKEEADIVVCGTKIDFEDGTTKIKTNQNKEILSTKEALIKLNSFSSFDMSVCNKIFKKEIVKGILFPVGKKSEDYFVMFQYFHRANKIVVLPEAKYHYFQRPNSISRGKNITHDYIEGAKAQQEFFKKNYPDIEFVGNTAYAFSYIATYNRYLKNKISIPQQLKDEFRKEVKKYLKDIRQNPYISRKKKIQAFLFVYQIHCYELILK